MQKPIASYLKPNYLKNIILGNLFVDSLQSLGKILFFLWDLTSFLGLISLTIAMLCVAYDCSSYVVSFISMCNPFIPESMLVSILPALVDLGFYTAQPETWYEYITSNFINGFNNTFDFISYYYTIFWNINLLSFIHL